jgi:hypothetical protein
MACYWPCRSRPAVLPCCLDDELHRALGHFIFLFCVGHDCGVAPADFFSFYYLCLILYGCWCLIYKMELKPIYFMELTRLLGAVSCICAAWRHNVAEHLRHLQSDMPHLCGRPFLLGDVIFSIKSVLLLKCLHSAYALVRWTQPLSSQDKENKKEKSHIIVKNCKIA